MTEDNNQDEQLKSLFATFAEEPPPTSMSSLKITARAISGSQSRTRRRNRVLGIAAAAVVLGVGGAVLVPKFAGTSVDEATSASTEVLLLQTVADSGAAALSAPDAVAGLSAAELAAPQTMPAAGGADPAESAAEAAAGVQTAAASEASQDSASDAAGPGTFAGSAEAAAAGSGFDIELAPESVGQSESAVRCRLTPLPAEITKQVSMVFPTAQAPSPISAPCGRTGSGSAFAIDSQYLAIYWLDGADPCEDLCTPGPTPDVRFRTTSGVTAVLVTAADGRVLVLKPLQPSSFDVTALEELGRTVAAATAE